MRCTEDAFLDVIKQRVRYVTQKIICCMKRNQESNRETLDDTVYIKRNMSLISSDMTGVSQRASSFIADENDKYSNDEEEDSEEEE